MEKEWIKILTDNQISKIKKENRRFFLIFSFSLGILALFGWFTSEKNRLFLPAIYILIEIYLIGLVYSFYGKFVFKIKIEGNGFWIKKKRDSPNL